MAPRKTSRRWDWRGIIQGLVGSLLFAVIIGISKCGKDSLDTILTKVSGHDEAIKKIPEISEQVKTVGAQVQTVNAKVDKKAAEITDTVDKTKTDLTKKVEGLISRDEMNRFRDQDNSRLSGIEKQQTDLQIRAAVQEALSGRPGTSPSPTYPPK